MKIRKMHLKPLLLLFLSILLSWNLLAVTAEAFSGQVIQKGAVGDDVIELQSRLQYLGYFKGKIDGVFGWSTYWGLRNFQSAFGMPIDGLAGGTTKAKLVKASKYNERTVRQSMNHRNNSSATRGRRRGRMVSNKTNATRKPTAANTPKGFSQNDIQLMANAVYGESRGEPFTGQVAVAAVIVNRLNSSNFPNSVSGVIFQPGAFTAVADGQIWLSPNERAKKAVIDALNGWDPTGNALYYFNPSTATSPWIWSRPQIKRIGKHIFCK